MRPSLRRLDFVSKVLRWLPAEIPGKTRLAKRLLGSQLQVENVKVTGRDGIIFVIPSLREPVGFYLLIDGIYEVEAVNFVLEHLKPGAVFIDVGANIGSFALPAARKVGHTGCVIAVEPSPRVFPYLQQNVTLNGLSNIKLIQCAVTDCDWLRLPFYEAPIEHFGMGSLGPQFHANPLSVLTHTLDHIMSEQNIESVDVIKVDVEGFEVAVFQGAEKLLTNGKSPIVVFEFCDWAEDRVPDKQIGDAQRLLKDWGYHIWRLKDLMNNKPPLAEVLTSGFETFVAQKNC